MSEAVMLSIRPTYCSLITKGEKTVEIRKTRPSITPPFKVYIYCTMGKNKLLDIVRDGEEGFGGYIHKGKTEFITMPEGDYLTSGKRGKVIGEFICDTIAPLTFDSNGIPHLQYAGDASGWRSCISVKEARAYRGHAQEKGLFAWHISNLVIYGEPKQLSEFMKPCEPDEDGVYLCAQCKRLVENYGCGGTILRPPQSWCYVEEMT